MFLAGFMHDIQTNDFLSYMLNFTLRPYRFLLICLKMVRFHEPQLNQGAETALETVPIM